MRIHAHKHQVASDKRQAIEYRTANVQCRCRAPTTHPAQLAASPNGQMKSEHARPASVRPPLAASSLSLLRTSRAVIGHGRGMCAGAAVYVQHKQSKIQGAHPAFVSYGRPPPGRSFGRSASGRADLPTTAEDRRRSPVAYVLRPENKKSSFE